MTAYTVVKRDVVYAGVSLEPGDAIDVQELPAELRGKVIMTQSLERLTAVRSRLAKKGLYDVSKVQTTPKRDGRRQDVG